MLDRVERAQRPLWLGWSVPRELALAHAASLDEQMQDALVALGPVFALDRRCVDAAPSRPTRKDAPFNGRRPGATRISTGQQASRSAVRDRGGSDDNGATRRRSRGRDRNQDRERDQEPAESSSQGPRSSAGRLPAPRIAWQTVPSAPAQVRARDAVPSRCASTLTLPSTAVPSCGSSTALSVGRSVWSRSSTARGAPGCFSDSSPCDSTSRTWRPAPKAESGPCYPRRIGSRCPFGPEAIPHNDGPPRASEHREGSSR